MSPLTFFQPGADPGDAAQMCPLCGASVPPSPRYPDYVCEVCVAEAVDEDGRSLAFFNTGLGGGFGARVVATGETRASHACFIRGVPCYADEARFGGIVVRPRR